jgi:hypothetical protein
MITLWSQVKGLAAAKAISLLQKRHPSRDARASYVGLPTQEHAYMRGLCTFAGLDPIGCTWVVGP